MSTKEAILRDSSSHAQLLAQITELDYVPPALQHKNTYIATLEKKLIELENQISRLKQTAIKKERQKHEAMHDTNEATTERIVAKITRRKEKVETKASKEENDLMEAPEEEKQAKREEERMKTMIAEGKAVSTATHSKRCGLLFAPTFIHSQIMVSPSNAQQHPPPTDLQTDAVRLCIAFQSQSNAEFLGAATELLSCVATLSSTEFRRQSRKPESGNTTAARLAMPAPDAFPPRVPQSFPRRKRSSPLLPFRVPPAVMSSRKRARHSTRQENEIPTPEPSSVTYAYKPPPLTKRRQALIEHAQTTLRHVVSARTVQSVVTEREAIAFEIAEIVGDVADKWGVVIEGILIKDKHYLWSINTMPAVIDQTTTVFETYTADWFESTASLSSAAHQKRRGENKVIAARAEVNSARLMRQTADILASPPAAMQIRQLEALQAMAKSGNSKVIFVPMQLQSDVVGQLASGSNNYEGSSSGAGTDGVARVGLLNSLGNI
ncbi:hypothetical protein B0H14DRAFT_3633121 [Mycena olivaceomarginata]|nr:hypothetical protein B0H14DRAFT_3633121 [Mycena olivaceomarginata]